MNLTDTLEHVCPAGSIVPRIRSHDKSVCYALSLDTQRHLSGPGEPLTCGSLVDCLGTLMATQGSLASGIQIHGQKVSCFGFLRVFQAVYSLPLCWV